MSDLMHELMSDKGVCRTAPATFFLFFLLISQTTKAADYSSLNPGVIVLLFQYVFLLFN